MKKNCDNARNAWLLDGAGELPRRRQDTMQRHVAGCGACRKWIAESDRWSRVAHSLTPDPPLNHATRAVILTAAVRCRSRVGIRTLLHTFSLPAMAAAMLLFAGLTAWQIMRMAPTPDSTAAALPSAGRMRVVDQFDALAYLLETVGDTRDFSDPMDQTRRDPLVDWILRTQAADTLEYLDDRLDAASG